MCKSVYITEVRAVALPLFACSWKRRKPAVLEKEVDYCLGHVCIASNLCVLYVSLSPCQQTNLVREDMATDIAPQIQHSKLSSWTSGKTSPPTASSTSLSCALESSMKMWQVSKKKKKKFFIALSSSLHGLRARRCIDVGRMAALIDNKLGIAGDSVEAERLWLKLLSKPLSFL